MNSLKSSFLRLDCFFLSFSFLLFRRIWHHTTNTVSYRREQFITLPFVRFNFIFFHDNECSVQKKKMRLQGHRLFANCQNIRNTIALASPLPSSKKVKKNFIDFIPYAFLYSIPLCLDAFFSRRVCLLFGFVFTCIFLLKNSFHCNRTFKANQLQYKCKNRFRQRVFSKQMIE